MSKAQQLHELCAEASELTIVCHNNPDPDCLASALALGRIAAAAGIDEHRILYSGDISHPQNRAFVNLFDLDLRPFDPAAVQNRPAGSLLAFVDHAIPGVNNRVPESTPVDIVIDHHPAGDIGARFVNHRESAGATATILTEYIRELGIELDSMLATALLFAIRCDTLGFCRRATRADYDAAGFLHVHMDDELLRQLLTPSVTGVTINAIGTAIANRLTHGTVLISNAGRTTERDALPQAADYLATLEGVETAIIFGIVNDSIHLSARSTDSRVHMGNVLREAFTDIGSAGGHQEMAGGELPLWNLADDPTDDAQLFASVEQFITARLVASLNLTADGAEGTQTSDAR